MGTFTVSIQVGDLGGQQFVDVEALVDTGATYTSIPGDILSQLGIEVRESRTFELADDRVVEYPVGYASIRLEEREIIALVVFALGRHRAAVGRHRVGNGWFWRGPHPQATGPRASFAEVILRATPIPQEHRAGSAGAFGTPGGESIEDLKEEVKKLRHKVNDLTARLGAIQAR